MAIPNTTKRVIRPTHPGEMLREDFMPDYDLNTASMAKALGVSRQTMNEILRERRAISPAMALRLLCLFGNSPEFWLNVQPYKCFRTQADFKIWERGRRADNGPGQRHPSEETLCP